MMGSRCYWDSKPDSAQGKNSPPQPPGYTLFGWRPHFPHPSPRLPHPFPLALSILPPTPLRPLLLGLWALPLHPPSHPPHRSATIRPDLRTQTPPSPSLRWPRPPSPATTGRGCDRRRIRLLPPGPHHPPLLRHWAPISLPPSASPSPSAMAQRWRGRRTNS